MPPFAEELAELERIYGYPLNDSEAGYESSLEGSASVADQLESPTLNQVFPLTPSSTISAPPGRKPLIQFNGSLERLLSKDRNERSASLTFPFGPINPSRIASQPIHKQLFTNTKISLPSNIALRFDNVLQSLDLRRFLLSYHKHSIPNVPFLHMPTLDFSDASLQSILSSLGTSEDSGSGCCCDRTSGIGCRRRRKRPVHHALLLSILTLGALYEDQAAFARTLLNETKKAITDFLADVQKKSAEPPVQLMQAFVHYIQSSIFFGDRVLDELAINHICCLASLVRAAKLTEVTKQSTGSSPPPDALNDEQHAGWISWAVEEERKRTFWGTFIMFSSVLTYLDTTTSFLDVQGVGLALPCSEELWEAETAQQWQSRVKDSPTDTPRFQSEFAKIVGRPEQTDHPSIFCGRESTTGTTFTYPAEDQDIIPHPRAGSKRPPMSEFGCLIMILALQVRVWSWNERYTPTDRQSNLERKTLDIALQRWQTLWLSYPPVTSTARLKVREILLLACLPIFDHAQLLLRVIIKDVKGAMHLRDYSKVCEAFAWLRVVKEEDSHGSASQMDSIAEDHSESFDYESCVKDGSFIDLREVATYAAHALEMSFQVGPWLSPKEDAKDVPIVCAITLFHCAQIVSSWLLRAAQFLDLESVTVIPTVETCSPFHGILEIADMALIEIVTQLVRNRKRDLEKLDNGHKAHGAVWNVEKGVAGLAVALLEIHAEIFERDFVQPMVGHLAKSLRFQARKANKNSSSVT